MYLNEWSNTAQGNWEQSQSQQPGTLSTGGREKPFLRRLLHECDGVTGKMGHRAAWKGPCFDPLSLSTSGVSEVDSVVGV